jgi:hypothetical protein
VSRIWDALKVAERDKARAKLSGKAQPDGSDRRRSKRWEQPVPVLIYGSDESRQPFHEESETIDINDDGCSIMLDTRVVRGQALFIVNMRNQAEREGRVVHIGKRVRGKYRVGVNFLMPGTNPMLPGHEPDFWRNS